MNSKKLSLVDASNLVGSRLMRVSKSWSSFCPGMRTTEANTYRCTNSESDA